MSDAAPARSDGAPRVAACLHGFLRSGMSMWPVRWGLKSRGWTEVALPTFVYQAGPFEAAVDKAEALVRRLSEQHGGVAIDLVTHSMGGLLARGVLARGAPVHRVVMLAPPNQGAWMAERARELLPVHRLGWDPLAPLLPGAPAALPDGEAAQVDIGILTGGSGDGRGLIPFVPDDNDGRVRVEEARLNGARAFRIVPYGHATIMVRPEVHALTARFLREGRFGEAA